MFIRAGVVCCKRRCVIHDVPITCTAEETLYSSERSGVDRRSFKDLLTKSVGTVMTQEQLGQIFDDVVINGRRVEGWSCEDQGSGHRLTDNKRNNTWERTSSDDAWIEKK